MNLYARKTNTDSPHEQGLIIDEDTGANIAVTYDSKHAGELAHAHKMFPKLTAALESLQFGSTGCFCLCGAARAAHTNECKAALRALAEAKNPEELK